MTSLICDIGFSSKDLFSVCALTVSIIALCINRKNSLKSIQLSIHQSLFKTAGEKAKDCNNIWESDEVDRKYTLAENKKLMSELIITTEILEKSVEFFSKNYPDIAKIKDDLYWLFWKQLQTDLRGWIRRTPEIVKQMEPKNMYYKNQVEDIQTKLSLFFEKDL